MKALRIWWLKSKAKRDYKRYFHALGGLDCGASLAQEISPAVRDVKAIFNATMDGLAKLDDATPTARL